MIHEETFADTGGSLLPAIQEGIIVPLNERHHLVHLQEQDREELDFGVSYKFQHDRVQQAAYSLIEEEERKLLHVKIARLIREHTPEENIENRLIEIVRHFNEGRDLIVDESEREICRLLYLRAGIKAKKSTAYGPAFGYVAAAKELLPENPWSERYELCFNIHKEYADTAYLSGKFEIAERTCETLIREAKTNFEKASIYYMEGVQYTVAGRLQETIDAAIKALSLLGTELSLEPDPAVVETALPISP